MRLVICGVEHRPGSGAINKNGSQVYPLASLDMDYKTMQELIETISDSEKQLLEYASGQDPYKARGAAPIGEISLLAPIPHPQQDIICLGIGYMAHAGGSARFRKEASDGERPYVVYFSKQVNRAMDPRAGVPDHRDIMMDSDHEAELTVVTGREASHVREEEVKDYIFGYTIINDVSARTLQARHKQQYFGKGLDGFLPMGSCVITMDELSYPPKVQVQSRANGELRRDSNTGQPIFDIDHVINELPRGMTLQPGTIIATGTPAGVGMGFDSPRFLVPGDVVERIIERIGTITNKVADRKETGENGLFTYDNTQTEEHCPDCPRPEETGTDMVVWRA